MTIEEKIDVLKSELSAFLETFRFKLNTDELRAEVESGINQRLADFAGDNANRIINCMCECDAENNTDDTIDNNKLVADVYLDVADDDDHSSHGLRHTVKLRLTLGPTGA